MCLIPEIERNVDQFSELEPVIRIHRTQVHRVHILMLVELQAQYSRKQSVAVRNTTA